MSAPSVYHNSKQAILLKYVCSQPVSPAQPEFQVSQHDHALSCILVNISRSNANRLAHSLKAWLQRHDGGTDRLPPTCLHVLNIYKRRGFSEREDESRRTIPTPRRLQQKGKPRIYVTQPFSCTNSSNRTLLIFCCETLCTWKT